MDLLARLLTLITWGGVAVLVLLLYRIAHFYQVTSGQTTHYRLYLVPMVLLLLGGLRYAMTGEWAGDMIGDMLHLIGGASLFVMGLLLLRMMTGGRK